MDLCTGKCFEKKKTKQICGHQLERSWQVLFYLTDYTCIKQTVISTLFLSRQNKTARDDHKKFLSADIIETPFKRSLSECQRKSAFRCPIKICETCICKFHLSQLDNNMETCFFLHSNNEFNSIDFSETELLTSNYSTSGIDMDFPIEIQAIEETEYFKDFSSQTETTSNLPTVEVNLNTDKIPFHFFFNQSLQIFRRLKKVPIISEYVQRFFQNFAAAQLHHSVFIST